jgi:secondary thiamine-phosphate synthase enzyme
MLFFQNSFKITGKSRGCHLITADVLGANPEISQISKGLLHLFIKHTSASIFINENADKDVPRDLEMGLSRIVPAEWPYLHHEEGADDMPAHLKTALVGCSLTLPITAGRLALGTWQGIFLWEHRDRAHSRELVSTLYGV